MINNIGIYESLTECSIQLKVAISEISQVIKGTRKQAGGYTFKLLEKV